MFTKIDRNQHGSNRVAGQCKADFGYCNECYAEAYCTRLTTRVTSDSELRNPIFVLGVKLKIIELSMGPKTLRDYLNNVVRDMRGGFYDLCDENVEVQFDLSFLEGDEGLEWLKCICSSAPTPETRCHVRKERWEDFRAVSSILRAADPIQALGWGGRSQGTSLI